MGKNKRQFTWERSGRSAGDNRKFITAVMWIAEHRGPAEYAKWSNKRFVRWVNDFLAVDDMTDSTIASVCARKKCGNW